MDGAYLDWLEHYGDFDRHELLDLLLGTLLGALAAATGAPVPSGPRRRRPGRRRAQAAMRRIAASASVSSPRAPVLPPRDASSRSASASMARRRPSASER